MSTGAVEQQLGHDLSSGSWNEPDYRQGDAPPTRGPRRAIASDTEPRT
jgi:hypothetical protein